MKEAARRRGVTGLVAPVRPTDKANVPTTSMEDYVTRRRPDGLPMDAWLRTHVRVGGKIVGVAAHSMNVAGTLTEWREWTGLAFDRPGNQLVDGGLVPVDVDIDRNLGVDIEPNAWVSHSEVARPNRPPSTATAHVRCESSAQGSERAR